MKGAAQNVTECDFRRLGKSAGENANRVRPVTSQRPVRHTARFGVCSPELLLSLVLPVVFLLATSCDRRSAQSGEPSVAEESQRRVQQDNATPAPAVANPLPSTYTQQPVSTRDAASTSRTGWGAVTWGMSEAEVRSAYPAAVPITPPDDYDRANAFATLRLGNVEAAGLNFDALFLFGKVDNRLTKVLLRRAPDEPFEYERVFRSLVDKYGPPIRSKELNSASLDTSSPDQAAKTRLGSGSAEWLSHETRISLEYLEAIGVRHLIVSYTARSADANL